MGSHAQLEGAPLGHRHSLIATERRQRGYMATDIDRWWAVWKFFSKLHYFLQKQEIQLIFEDREGGVSVCRGES